MTLKQRFVLAERLAVAYIKSVDQFLTSYYGAEPELGTGHRSGDYSAKEAKKAPWCADWAYAMRSFMRDKINKDPELKKVFGVEFNRRKFNIGQHNWIMVYVTGHKPPDPAKNTNVDFSGVVFLDPWFDILPKAYTSTFGVHITPDSYTPTD